MKSYIITVRSQGAYHRWMTLPTSFLAAFMAAYDRFADQNVSIGVRPC